MKTIGLICEGVSEINVIETILSRFLGADFYVNPIEPETVIENGMRKQATGGGWSRVLAHCNEQKFSEILQLNDYLVVQIDSDASEQYGVPSLDSNHKKKVPKVLYQEIVSRLCQGCSESFLKSYSGRILFAICFNEIECWLLPIIVSGDSRCRTHNCIFVLNQELAKKNLPVIPSGDNKNSPNAVKAYRKILKNIKNKSTVKKISVFNHGFTRFVEDLERLL